MKVLSWNINGIRAGLRKGFEEFLKENEPDILFLQEIKISREDIQKNEIVFPGYEIHWNPAVRPGYSGTAILIKEKTKKKLEAEVEENEDDKEGRMQFLKGGDILLANIYFPNAGPQLERLNYKIEFNNILKKKLEQEKRKRRIIVGGDFNVAHQEIDIARPQQNEGKAGFTKEEREWMTEFLDSGYIDTFRHFYPDTVKYSWWSYRAKARDRNVGWRLDYFCADRDSRKKIKDAFIWDSIKGSDHCPVGIDLLI